MSEMNWKQRALANLMSEISEYCYCAGWMSGNEYTLWEMVANPNASRHYGQDDVTEAQIADLKAISEEVGGWIRWVDDSDFPGLPNDEWGCKFVPMDEWLKRYECRMKEWAEMHSKLAKETPA